LLLRRSSRSYSPRPVGRKPSLIPSAKKQASRWTGISMKPPAGRAFQQYVARRRKQLDSGPRRILADFLIGAHALHHGFRLLTLDDRLYRAAFPRLAVLSV